MMALVHDLAEAQGDYIRVSHIFEFSHNSSSFSKVGDISPREGIPKAEKHRLESVKRPYSYLILALLIFIQFLQDAMHNFVHDMLHNSPAAQRIESLWRVRFAKSLLMLNKNNN